MVQLKPSMTSCTMGTIACLYSFSWWESQPKTCRQEGSRSQGLHEAGPARLRQHWDREEGGTAPRTLALSNLKVLLVGCFIAPCPCWNRVTSRRASLVVMTCGVLSASSRSFRGLCGWTGITPLTSWSYERMSSGPANTPTQRELTIKAPSILRIHDHLAPASQEHLHVDPLVL